jgi:hypothetical protein
MLKELTMAILLTIIFSVGVGVLFVRTIVQMVELLVNGEIAKKDPAIEASSKKHS